MKTYKVRSSNEADFYFDGFVGTFQAENGKEAIKHYIKEKNYDEMSHISYIIKYEEKEDKGVLSCNNEGHLFAYITVKL